jgi:hypothetical protein
MDQPRTWHISRNSPARADAPGIFVPSLDLPEASIGDEVIVDGPDDEVSSQRRAMVSALEHRDGVAYLRLDFASPR